MRADKLLTATCFFSMLAIVAGLPSSVKGKDLPQTATWTIVKSPNGGSQVDGNKLLAAVDSSATNAWAVGAVPAPSAYLTATLVEHWNGARWSIVPTPDISRPTTQLNSISEAGSEVWAAGYSDDPSCLCGQSVAERWNGSSWTRMASPNPGVADYVNGITVISPHNVWLVGTEWISNATKAPLIEHFDGQRWSAVDESQLQSGTLLTVVATGADDIWALGIIGSANPLVLALHWNGTSWKQEPFPSESSGYIVIHGASGVAKNDLWAVGVLVYNDQSFYLARSYHWDGSSWKRVDVANLSQPSFFLSVKAIATNNVWAVGQGVVLPNNNNVQNVTYHWNGSGWHNVPNPDNLENAVMWGIAASSSSDIWAVGQSFASPPPTGTFTMHAVQSP